MRLGRVQDVTEGSVQWLTPRLEARSLAASAGGQAATPIEPGRQRIEARVTVTYRLQPAPARAGRGEAATD